MAARGRFVGASTDFRGARHGCERTSEAYGEGKGRLTTRSLCQPRKEGCAIPVHAPAVGRSVGARGAADQWAPRDSQPTRLAVGPRGWFPSVGRIEVLGPKFSFFFFFLFLFPLFVPKFHFNFKFKFKSCAKLYSEYIVKLKVPIIILLIFPYRFSPYFQNPNFNLGFNPTSKIVISLLLSLLFYLMHKHITPT
jgi:hypothetical protein